MTEIECGLFQVLLRLNRHVSVLGAVVSITDQAFTRVGDSTVNGFDREPPARGQVNRNNFHPTMVRT